MKTFKKGDSVRYVPYDENINYNSEHSGKYKKHRDIAFKNKKGFIKIVQEVFNNDFIYVTDFSFYQYLTSINASKWLSAEHIKSCRIVLTEKVNRALQ